MDQTIRKGLIVSCQALKNEPLYGGDTIAKMAVAAQEGGAVAIRANTVRDIKAIARRLKGGLPIIGLIKRDYPDSSVYITPTLKEVKALSSAPCAVIAMDATQRTRPGGVGLKELVEYVRNHSDKPIMADIATDEEALAAEALGFDYVSTTLRSYTEETQGIAIPDVAFCERLARTVRSSVVVAEGGIHTDEELSAVLKSGIDRVVIGGAITRPQNITRSYVQVFSQI